MITVSIEDILKETGADRFGKSTERRVPNETDTLDAPGSGECCLLRIHPLELENAQYEFGTGEIVFGRDTSADVVIDDRSVSRRHASVDRIGELYVLTDLGSTNGTFVNGKRVDMQPLHAGDRVRIGDQIFKFMERDGIEAQYHNLVLDNMSRDPLTGAYNKRYFSEVLERQINTSARDQTPVSLVMLDIDHFKTVNDTHGHLAGDDVLKELVRRLTEALRGEEVFARYGGEEFVILAGDASGAAVVAERCRHIVAAAPFDTSAGSLPITISLGVATRSGEFFDTDLIAASDVQLYEAKRDGRNRVCVEPAT